ncbi:MAG: signal peptidase I [bacterium]|nr:signal peptidase I [bacterium]
MIVKAFNSVFIVFIFTITLVLTLSALNWVRLLVVKTGSMSPNLPINSLLVVFPEKSIFSDKNKNYETGEVVSFQSAGTQSLITHRINKIVEKDGITYYQTKGDANQGPDSTLIRDRNIFGKVVFSAPLLGVLAAFLGSFPGLFILVIIPASFVILHEFLVIAEEMKRMKKKKKEKLNTRVLTAPALVLIFLLFAVPAFSLFKSSVILESNRLSTGEISSAPLECSDIEFSGEPILGTEASDRLIGTAGNDLIFGFGGGDLIEGKGGNDCLVGGDGGDKLKGGPGQDILLGGQDSDSLQAGSGADELFGAEGSDSLNGSSGNDKLFGGPGSDGLSGGSGEDFLDAGNGSDKNDGGAQTDTCLNGENNQNCEVF